MDCNRAERSPRRGIELAWVHSWELRLLAHTGIVGFLALIAFLGAAVTAALRRRAPRGSLRGVMAGIGVSLLIEALHLSQ